MDYVSLLEGALRSGRVGAVVVIGSQKLQKA